jgi:hypothetical protein
MSNCLHFLERKEIRIRGKKWLSQIMRPLDYEPQISHRVCSLHFIDGKPTKENPFPTLFLGIIMDALPLRGAKLLFVSGN